MLTTGISYDSQRFEVQMWQSGRGGGVIAAAISGAVAGGLNASVNKAPATAVLANRVSPQYFAPGPLNAFRRVVVGEIVMFKGDTHELLLRQRVYRMKPGDPYSYMMFDSLVKDLPR